jgi:hypothetical protein
MHFWRSFQNYLLGKGFPPPRLLQNYYLAHDLLTLDHENDLRNSHLSYLINPNGSFVGTKGTGSAQVMPSSSVQMLRRKPLQSRLLGIMFP